MKFRAKQLAIRNMTPEQERDLLARQRDSLLRKCEEAEKWCPLISIKDVYRAFLHDPADKEEEQ